MAYYSTHDISQFLLNNEKQRVRFLLAHPVGRGRWLMQDDMPYGPIEGQGQGHEPFKVWIPSIFNIYLLRHLQRELANDH